MAAGVAKGSGVPNREKVGKVTKAQLLEIVKKKGADINARDDEQADAHDRRHGPQHGHCSGRLNALR